jgi:voltage-gated potassium channel
MSRPADRTFKENLYRILESGHADDIPSQVFDWTMVILIIVNVGAITLETVDSLHATWGPTFWWIEIVTVAAFTFEYAARLWVSDQHLPLRRHGPFRARLRYVVSPFAIIDVVAIAPFYVSLFVAGTDLRILLVFRLMRLLKLARYSPALATLGRVLKEERRALGAAIFVMMVILTIAATAMYHAEREVQPEVFGSIPNAMWWAIATLTTVGYGDTIPQTGLGRLIGGVVMVIGIGMFAIPIGIIASGFSSEIHRRDFVVSWGMVSRVPLFSSLDPQKVSRITSLLRSRVIPGGTVIARRGEEAHDMFFITSGEVEIEVSPEPIILAEGDFFGEVALIKRSTRTATVRTLSQVSLLVLNAEDFHDLMREDAVLREHVTRVAEDRFHWVADHPDAETGEAYEKRTPRTKQ